MKKSLLIMTLIIGIGSTTVYSKPSKAFSWRKVENKAFGVGEELTYEMGWKSMVAGSGVLKVTDIRQHNKRPVYRVVFEASSNDFVDVLFKVRDSFESLIDVGSISSVGFAKKIKEGGYQKDVVIQIDQPTGTFDYKSQRKDKDRPANIKKGKIPPYAQDMISSFYYFRTLKPEKVESTVIPVLDGDEMVTISFKKVRDESIETGAGKFDCVILRPAFANADGSPRESEEDFHIWVSKDQKRLPVMFQAKMSFGLVVGKLAEVKN